LRLLSEEVVMNGRLCEACQNLGQYIIGTNLDAIYQNGPGPQIVRLCYGHSVELFKLGQRNFLSKYGHNLIDTSFKPQSGSYRLKNYFVLNSFGKE
jgi:hypothetical protein